MVPSATARKTPIVRVVPEGALSSPGAGGAPGGGAPGGGNGPGPPGFEVLAAFSAFTSGVGVAFGCAAFTEPVRPPMLVGNALAGAFEGACDIHSASDAANNTPISNPAPCSHQKRVGVPRQGSAK